MPGYVWGTVADAIRRYKGAPGVEEETAFVAASLHRGDRDELRGDALLPVVRVSRGLATALQAEEGSLLYVCDPRWWLGGLRATHAVVGAVADDPQPWVELGPEVHAGVVHGDGQVQVQRIC